MLYGPLLLGICAGYNSATTKPKDRSISVQRSELQPLKNIETTEKVV